MRLLQVCCNHHGSGLAGGRNEAKNFRAVTEVLRRFGARVRVVDVQCRGDFWNRCLLGVWNLGATSGAVLGTLVWSRVDQHVFAADCRSMQTLLDSCGSSCGLAPAPWHVCNVGAPKKKSKRGAHLKGHVGSRFVRETGELEESMGAEDDNGITSLPCGTSSAENASGNNSTIDLGPADHDPDCGKDLASTGGSLQGSLVDNVARLAPDADQASDNDGGSSMCFDFDRRRPCSARYTVNQVTAREAR